MGFLLCYVLAKDAGTEMFHLRLWKKKAVGLGFVLLTLILTSSPPAPACELEQTPAEKTLGSLEKSLLLPGWGQLSEKRYIEAALVFAAEAFCVYKIFANNHLANENYALYKKATTMDEAVRTRQLTEQYDTRRNQFMLAAAAVWAANLVDIYLIVKAKGKQKKALTLRIERGEPHQISITASCRF